MFGVAADRGRPRDGREMIERRARDDRETGARWSRDRRGGVGPPSSLGPGGGGAQPLGRTTVAHRVQPSGTRAKSNGSPRRFTIVLVTHITAEWNLLFFECCYYRHHYYCQCHFLYLVTLGTFTTSLKSNGFVNQPTCPINAVWLICALYNTTPGIN